MGPESTKRLEAMLASAKAAREARDAAEAEERRRRAATGHTREKIVSKWAVAVATIRAAAAEINSTIDGAHMPLILQDTTSAGVLGGILIGTKSTFRRSTLKISVDESGQVSAQILHPDRMAKLVQFDIVTAGPERYEAALLDLTAEYLGYQPTVSSPNEVAAGESAPPVPEATKVTVSSPNEITACESAPPTPEAADPLRMLKTLNLHHERYRDDPVKPLPENKPKQRPAQELQVQSTQRSRILEKMVGQTWLVVPIAVAVLFAIRLVADELPPERALPNALGGGIGVWIISVVIVRVAAWVTRQRAVPVLARRVWIFAIVLLFLQLAASQSFPE
jgi:hypothetical protein